MASADAFQTRRLCVCRAGDSPDARPIDYMKLNTESPESSVSSAATEVPKHFRRLESHEVVKRGDFVRDEQGVMGPWDGPTGFWASTYVQPIYRATGLKLSLS